MNEIEVKLNTSPLSVGSIIVLGNLNSYIVITYEILGVYQSYDEFNAVNLATGTMLFESGIDSLESLESELQKTLKNKFDDISYCVINNAKISISG